MSHSTRAVELPEVARTVVSITIVILTGLAFAAIFVWAIVQTWASAPGMTPKTSDSFSYVSTALAALVGGIVAVGFGLKQPPTNPPSAGRLARSLDGLSRLGVSQVLLILYVLLYFACGFGALVTWVLRTPETPELVKNLAVTFLGMLIAIVGAFFS